MSAAEAVIAVKSAVNDPVWQMRRSQLAAVVRLELRKNFFRVRGLWVYLLALAPALIIGGHAIYDAGRCNFEDDQTAMAAIFQFFYVRLAIFFGCMGIFTRLFRGDMVERSLHYYFLAPLRREILVIGKWLAGAIAASCIFALGVLLSFLFMFGHHGDAGAQFWSTDGPRHLAMYLGVTVLACFGYGALFLLMGLLFRNPIIPAVVIALWEGINHLLPSMLKKLSVIFYLEPLCPVEVPLDGVGALFALSADPISPWLAVPGLLLFSAVVLAYACVRIRRVEINYGAD